VALDPRTGRLLVMSALDNLVKGASGQAVQEHAVMAAFLNRGTYLTPPPT